MSVFQGMSGGSWAVPRFQIVRLQSALDGEGQLYVLLLISPGSLCTKDSGEVCLKSSYFSHFLVCYVDFPYLCSRLVEYLLSGLGVFYRM